MATEAQLIQALKAADAAGNAADARKLALAIKAQRAAPSEEAPAVDESADFAPASGYVPTDEDRAAFEAKLPENEPATKMGFLNKGIAETLGSPVDMISGMLRNESKAIGRVNKKLSDFLPSALQSERGIIPDPFGGVPEDSIGGSQSIRSVMSAVGADTPDRAPQTIGESIAAVTGETAGFAVPLAGLARRYQAAEGIGGKLAAAMNEAHVTKPVAALMAEAGGAAGAGAGRHIAEQNDMSAGGSLATELIGGIAGSFAGTGGMTKRLFDFTKEGGAKLLFPYTEAGAEVRASRRLRELATDPKKAAQEIEALKETNLLPASRSGEPGLMALERTVLEQDPALEAIVRENRSGAMQKLVSDIRHSGSVSKAREFIEAKRQRLFSALDARVDRAAEEASAKLANLSEEATTGEISAIVREQLDTALADAKVQEGMLWQAVPQNTPIPTRATRKAYQSALDSLSAAQLEDMPPVARQVVDALEDQAPLQEIDGFYKKLGEVGRKARMDGERNKSRLAEELRSAILEDIGHAKGPPDVKRSLDTARAFSRQIAERFRQGPVGKLFATDQTGALRVPETLTLETTVGRAGNRGRVNVDAINQAAGPAALEPVQSYMKRLFTEQALDQGRVNPAKADAFLRKHAPTLEAFPHLRDQMRAAQTAEDVARRVEKSSDGLRRAFQKPEVSSAARFLGAPVDQEIQRIFRAPDPAKTMNDIMRSARRNKSATAGIKAGVSEYLLNKATRQTFDITGHQPVSGLALQKMLKDPTTLKTLRQVYDPAELAKIQRSADMLAVIDKRMMSKAKLGNIIDDTPAIPFMVASRVIGAKVGAAFSSGPGASIQAAQIGSSQARNWLQRLTSGKAERLITEAIQDPELMKRLLVDFSDTKAPKVKQAERYLRAWSANAGLQLFDDKE